VSSIAVIPARSVVGCAEMSMKAQPTQRPDVGTGIVLVAADDFGRHPARRADKGLAFADFGRDRGGSYRRRA
jgi:hypothetical protein